MKLWTWLTRGSRKDDELREELQFHLQEETETRTGAGVNEARLAARRELGNLRRIQEETRAVWTATLFER